MRLGEILDLRERGRRVWRAPRRSRGLASDSRKVAARATSSSRSPGAKDDGLAYAAEALARGASVIVAERAPDFAGAGLRRVADARAALARAAARFYPRQPATIVAVTGTSGKTSVAAFARQIWATLGFEAASLGTIGVVSRPVDVYGSLTTPDPITLHRDARRARRRRRHASGDGSLLARARPEAARRRARSAAGAFTNLSRDHLDYHATMEAYLAAKLRLFATSPAGRAGRDRRRQRRRAARRRAPRARAGASRSRSARRARRSDSSAATREGFATRLELDHDGRTPTCAAAAARRFPGLQRPRGGGSVHRLRRRPRRGVRARWKRWRARRAGCERVGEKRGAAVFVDYAHKPDALEKTLRGAAPVRAAAA